MLLCCLCRFHALCPARTCLGVRIVVVCQTLPALDWTFCNYVVISSGLPACRFLMDWNRYNSASITFLCTFNYLNLFYNLQHRSTQFQVCVFFFQCRRNMEVQPNTLPTVFFIAPVKICPPMPPIPMFQPDEAMLLAHRCFASRSLI
jgi:hypothetical protein